MPEETARFVTVCGLRLRIRTSPDFGANLAKPILVLFHGFSFSIDEWETIGTLSELPNRAVPYLAVDLPKGKASKSQKRTESQTGAYVPVLGTLFRSLGIDPVRSKLIIIGPSMGGAFALAYALEKRDEVMGLILVAPSLAGVDEGALENLDVPVLLIWGDKDTIFPVSQNGRELKELLPRAKLLILKGARHPAYLDKPEEFHGLVFDFIDEISS
jgi:abhydrolase domain-containing protein 14